MATGLYVAVLFLSLCSVLLSPVEGTLGVDLSTSTSKSAFSCLKGESYEFVIVRGYRSYGEPDPEANSNIYNAKAAGFDYVDVYMFPCPKCSKSASEQVNDMGIALQYKPPLSFS